MTNETQADQARLEALCVQYGASGFIVQRDGQVQAICGQLNFPVDYTVTFNPSPAELMQEALAAAAAKK